MILHDGPPQRKTLAPDFTNIPAALAALNTWACWRARKKAHNGDQQVVYQRVHPVSGAEPRGGQPEQWASFEAVLHPRLRKPVDGIGVYPGQDSGLAVVFNADPGLPARLGDQVIYAERSVSGDGLTVVVRVGVLGAVADRFIPLSGQPPYQGEVGETSAVCLDAVWTPSGHEPYQENDLSGQGPCQENAPCLDKGRTLVPGLLKTIMQEVGARRSRNRSPSSADK